MTDDASPELDGEAWLQQIESVIDRRGEGCRVLDIADEICWGQANELPELREILKAHPARFKLQGNIVSRRGGSSRAMAVAGDHGTTSFNEGLWLQRVESAIATFGGRCEFSDVADRLLWGAEGSGTERRGLRDFIRAHPLRFGLQATTVSLHSMIEREGVTEGAPHRTSPAPLPWQNGGFPRVDQNLLIQRVRWEVWRHTNSTGGVCTIRDLYERLNWGVPASTTYRASLRDFLATHHDHFELDGYNVSLVTDSDLVERAACGFSREQDVIPLRTVSPNADVLNDPSFGAMETISGKLLTFHSVETALDNLGGVCTCVDLTDMLLVGMPGSYTEGQSLRKFLRKHSQRFVLDGTLVCLRNEGLQSDAAEEEVLVCLAEAVVRRFGGTCTMRDLHIKLNWGKSPRTGSESGRSLGDFLAAHTHGFKLGGSPTPGSCDGRSLISVSLCDPEKGFDEKLWLQKVASVIHDVGNACTTKDVYDRLHWGRPSTGTRGRVLREFLVGHDESFGLSGFSLSVKSQQFSHDTHVELPPEPMEWMRTVVKALEAAGGECRVVDLSQQLEWPHGVSTRDYLSSNADKFILKGTCVKLRKGCHGESQINWDNNSRTLGDVSTISYANTAAWSTTEANGLHSALDTSLIA